MRNRRVLLNEIMISDEPGFACSKNKLVEDGLIHFRPFNLTYDGSLSFDQIYRVPPEEAPNGKRMLEEGDILFNNTNSVELVGKASLVERPIEAGFSNHLTRLRFDKSKIVPHYAAFWLRQVRATGFFSAHATRWVGQAAFKTSELRKMKIDLPPLEEQRRIVDILSRAEGIVRLRREAQKKAEELIPALFLEMFGDPATNPKGWAVKPFSQFGYCRLGKMLDKKRQSGQYEKPYLRNVNVKWDYIDTNDMFKMDFMPGEQEIFKLQKGDVLICEGGEIGRAAIWDDQIEECYFQKALHRLRPDPKNSHPDFVVWLLWHLAKSGAFPGSTTQATIAHLTGVQLKNLKVISPPVEKQGEFENIVINCHSIQHQQEMAAERAEAAFESLLAEFFNKATTKV